ncbi:hypothetical protein JB92DRAFT_2964787 [Gautieria morchelliformis]|nr:hypothetical protein JB92DRAFT_2964787 [Gautieria morchelliformis]
MAPVPPLRSIMNTRSPGLHDHQSLELSSSTGMPSSPSVHAAHRTRGVTMGERPASVRHAPGSHMVHTQQHTPPSEPEAPPNRLPPVVRRTSTPIPGRRSKVKLTDFDAEYHATINLACRFYRVILCTEDPFPLDHDQDGYLREAWSLACKEHQVELGVDSAAFNLIRQRGSQVRGEVKRNARPVATLHYGFSSSPDSAHRSQMATLAQTLTNKHTLVYRDHEARKGLFETPCLIHILQTQWFADPHDEGVAFHLYFNPIPLPTMALVFMAIENCIDEWKDGQLKPVDFTEKSHREKYLAHLTNLKGWRGHVQGKHLLAHMQQRLHDEARTHSGAGVLQEEGQLSGLTNDDFDEAAREAAGDSEEEREAAHA